MDWIDKLLQVDLPNAKKLSEETFPPVGDWHGVNTAAIEGFEKLKKVYFTQGAEAYAKYRKLGKALGLAFCYGATAAVVYRNYPDYGMPKCEKIVADFFKSFPTLKEHMERILEEVMETGSIETFLGRKIPIENYELLGEKFLRGKDWMLANKATNAAYNYPIQAGGGEIIRMILVYAGDYNEAGSLYKYQGNNITKSYSTRILVIDEGEVDEEYLDELPDGNVKILLVTKGCSSKDVMKDMSVVGEYSRNVQISGNFLSLLDEAEVAYKLVF